MNLNKLFFAVLVTGLLSLPALAQDGPPTCEVQDTYTVGFAQTESNNPWRIAETASMEEEAAARGDQIVVTDAGGSAAKQVADVQSLIAQGVDAIFLAPREETPLARAVLEAKRASIPVILLDRDVDQEIATVGEDYVTFIGSDFVDQGRRAAEWLVEATGGETTIIELEGTTGSSPANDRKQGFDDVIAEQEGMEIVASQSADFARTTGREVMETLLQSNPEVTAVYAHNDEMALGAIAALEAAGRTPGEDVTVVSIDGTRDALQAIIDGTLGATVESSPFFGPVALDTLRAYCAGEDLEPWIKVEDKFFDPANAEEFIDEAY